MIDKNSNCYDSYQHLYKFSLCAAREHSKRGCIHEYSDFFVCLGKKTCLLGVGQLYRLFYNFIFIDDYMLHDPYISIIPEDTCNDAKEMMMYCDR